jgi:hypothetical protein
MSSVWPTSSGRDGPAPGPVVLAGVSWLGGGLGADAVVLDTRGNEVFDGGRVDVSGDHGDKHRVVGDRLGRVADQPGAAVADADRGGGAVGAPPGPRVGWLIPVRHSSSPTSVPSSGASHSSSSAPDGPERSPAEWSWPSDPWSRAGQGHRRAARWFSGGLGGQVRGAHDMSVSSGWQKGRGVPRTVGSRARRSRPTSWVTSS